ncbi:MAG TPA: metal ABC transporter permease [Candidatus Limnocylindrales bacterium]|jgi:ABC-type Mn2+/Zn2+ transport system permease subunit
MDVAGFFTDPMAYGFMQRGLVAAIVVGIVCAVMGTFVVLKGIAFIGDAVSHASFPGVVIAFIAGLPIYLGGAVAAVGTALAIGFVSRRSRLRLDTAIGVLFAGAFAFGVLLYSTIDGYTGDLLGYLLGNILGIGLGDLIQVTILGAAVLAIVFVIRKELLYATFDPLGAAASGLPVGGLEYLLLGLLGVTIIVSIQAVGIILVVAMLVTPPATAQLLVVRFDRMTLVAATLATLAAVIGLYGSFYLNVASGPAIVLVETGFFLAALVLGPRTGLVARRAARRMSMAAEAV